VDHYTIAGGNEMESAVYTDGELADLLQVSRPTIRRWWWRKLLPAPVKLGAVIRWRKSDINEWLAEQEPHSLYVDANERKLV